MPVDKQKSTIFPIGRRLNSELERHLISRDEVPFCSNAVIGTGLWEKRKGFLPVQTFNGELYDVFIPKKGDYALVAAVDDSAGDVKIYEWDLDLVAAHPTWDFPNVGMKQIGSGFAKTRANDDSTKARWSFTLHYDRKLGQCIIFTNGEDLPQVYYIKHPTTSGSNRTMEPLPFASGTDGVENVVARFVSSNKASVYFSYAAIGDNLTACRVEITAGINRFQTVYSSPGDGRSFSSSQRKQDRPEDALVISGMERFKQNLYVGKESQDLWQVAAYNNWQNTNVEHGFTAPNGQVAADNLYYTSDGKVFTLDGNFLSALIDKQFAGTFPGNWDDIHAIQDRFNKIIHFSSKNRIWDWDRKRNTWYLEEYPANVEVMGDMPAYKRFLYQWEGKVNDHQIILAEEDILSDIVFKFGEKTLVRRAPNWKDNGTDDIQTILDTVWEFGQGLKKDAADWKKQWKRFVIHGTPGATVNFKADFSDYPRLPTFTSYGDITINAAGYGSITHPFPESRYATARLTESSTSEFVSNLIGWEFDWGQNITAL